GTISMKTRPGEPSGLGVAKGWWSSALTMVGKVVRLSWPGLAWGAAGSTRTWTSAAKDAAASVGRARRAAVVRVIFMREEFYAGYSPIAQKAPTPFMRE